MGKIAVVYKSKHGATRQYAQWIAEETGADLFNVEQCKGKELAGYETVVYGGGIHAGGIMGIDFLSKNRKYFYGKKVLVFAVGINVDNEAAKEECKEINLVKHLEGLPCYFMQGAYRPEEITGMDKVIMGMVKKMVPADSQLYRDIEQGADYISRQQIREIVEAINE